MLSNKELKNLPSPRQLLGDELFTELQNLLISIHRRGGTAVMTNEHPALILNCSREGIVAKVDTAMTTVL